MSALVCINLIYSINGKSRPYLKVVRYDNITIFNIKYPQTAHLSHNRNLLGIFWGAFFCMSQLIHYETFAFLNFKINFIHFSKYLNVHSKIVSPQ